MPCRWVVSPHLPRAQVRIFVQCLCQSRETMIRPATEKKSRRSWQESQTAKRKVIEIRRFTCLPTPVLPKRTSAVTLALGIDATFPVLPFLHSGRDDSQPDWVKTTKNGGRTWDQNKALSETCHLLQPSSTNTSTSVYHSEFSIPPFALSSPTKPHQTSVGTF